MATPPFKVKALYDYVSQEDEDLNFKGGQIITVTDEEDADWYYGEYEDDKGGKQEGLFPKNFVQAFEPETPPRPTRAIRNKKDVEPAITNRESHSSAVTEPLNTPASEDATALTLTDFVAGTEQIPAEAPEAAMHEPPRQEPPREVSITLPPKSAASEPLPRATSKPAPPLVTEKPASNAFRDRINAFNKQAAAPLTPIKPGNLGSSSGSGFIKKPFVAPPPSKNAYVAPPRDPNPQKVYRREEDPEVLAQSKGAGGDDVRTSQIAIPAAMDDEDRPVPASLKDRIALLQKQQMEQAARHVEASQRKEKVRRPKKSADTEGPGAEHRDADGDAVEDITNVGTSGNRLEDALHETAPQGNRSRSHKTQEASPMTSPVAAPPREIFSDGNDADQSGGGETEEGEETSTGRDDSDEKPRGKVPISIPGPTQRMPQEALTGDGSRGPAHIAHGREDEEVEEEEEEEIDPEVKRRMEIRERMAKMSGGMGMAGMFGPSGGLPPRTSTKKGSEASERKDSAGSTHAGDTSASRAPPVPVMPTSRLQKDRNPERSPSQVEVEKEGGHESQSLHLVREPEDMPDLEDIQCEPAPPVRKSMDRAADLPRPQARPVPPPPPRQSMSQSEESEPDDELSSYGRIHSLQETQEVGSSRPTSKEGLPALSTVSPPSIARRPQAPPSRPSQNTVQALRNGTIVSVNTSPINATEPHERPNRVGPVPESNAAMPSASQNRAPPPPPPSAPAPIRTLTRNSVSAEVSKIGRPGESDEEVTEYDGDYDTDIASGATCKDALKSHARAPSLEDDSMTEEASLHHSGLPSIGPPPSAAPRAAPPPPPQQAPSKKNRQSTDMPRGAPPPPPAPKHAYEDEDEEYDPYKYTLATREVPGSRREDAQIARTPTVEQPEMTYKNSPPHQSRASSSREIPSQYSGPPNMTMPSNYNPRLSSDIQRSSTTIRRSIDMARPSGEHFMASDVDLGQASRWWAQTDMPPPVFQNRRDVIYEVEENSTTRRGGKKSITKDVYVLYMDYSQTVVTAHFEAADPDNITLLEQRHESPPRILRQDQLEEAHTRFGTQIANAANSMKETVVGDGSPHALPLEIISSIPYALRPVGVRAYGAIIYANLANASVQQYDEIRPGDIITFRNAKFGGHRGPMKSKYSLEVGKPDHVGVVIDWDGTKKKVRAWEQGRESKKVRPESFKFGDMKSGE
ncbi:MAG: hypothetical protein Q9163_005010, partial [Psora crenata]